MNIDWEGLIVGFESRSRLITHFFDKETGDVEQVLVRDAERHARVSADPRFVALPRDEGERSVGDLEEFLAECEDDACRRELGQALAGAAPAADYREVLMRHPKEEARFFQFKEHQALKRAQAWLEEIGIPLPRPQREA